VFLLFQKVGCFFASRFIITFFSVCTGEKETLNFFFGFQRVHRKKSSVFVVEVDVEWKKKGRKLRLESEGT